MNAVQTILGGLERLAVTYATGGTTAAAALVAGGLIALFWKISQMVLAARR